MPMSVSYLTMGFLDIGIEKPRGSRTASARASLAALKRRRRLRYFSQIDRLTPVFGLVFRRNTYDWRCARHWYFMTKFWNRLHETFNWIYDKNAFLRIGMFPFLPTPFTTPSLTFHLWTSENQINGVGSRSGRINQSQCMFTRFVIRLVLPLLLPTATIWFSLVSAT